jgi:hypothetical protein
MIRDPSGRTHSDAIWRTWYTHQRAALEALMRPRSHFDEWVWVETKQPDGSVVARMERASNVAEHE